MAQPERSRAYNPKLNTGDASHLKAYRWKPGQSGNPSGTKRGRVTFESIVAKILDERVGVTVPDQLNDDGSPLVVSITKREAVAAAFVDELLARNRDAMREFLARVWPTDQAKAVAGMFQTWTDLVQEHDTEQAELADGSDDVLDLEPEPVEEIAD